MAVGSAYNLFIRDGGGFVPGIVLMNDWCDLLFIRSGRTANKFENTGDYDDWLHSVYSVRMLKLFGYCRKRQEKAIKKASIFSWLFPRGFFRSGEGVSGPILA